MKGVTPYANSVFEQPWWLDIVANGEWREATVEDNSGVIARLPYVYYPGRWGGVIKNPPFTQTLGIWLSDSIKSFQRGNSQLHRQKEIIVELLGQLPRASEIHLALDSNMEYVLPFRWQGFRIIPSWSYRLDLTDMDRVNNEMGKTVYKNLKAARRGLTVNESSNFVEFWKLINQTFDRQNRHNPINKEVAERVVAETIKNHHGKIFTAYDSGGVAHSTAFFVYDEKICFYLMGGQNPEYKSDGCQNLVLYEAIQFASTVSEKFDFEGSMVEGIENFFRQFGGYQVLNYHISKKPLMRVWLDDSKPYIKKLLGYKI